MNMRISTDNISNCQNGISFLSMNKPTKFEGQELEDRVQQLRSYDLSRVLQKCEKKEGYDPATAAELGVEYKKYLELRLRHPELKIPMAGPVDPVWHHHILFSNDYTDMCKQIFGCYIHHKPCESEVEEQRLRPDYLQNTLGLYRKYFGEPDPKHWPLTPVCVGDWCGNTCAG